MPLAVTPASTPCLLGFVVQLPSQQDVVQQPQRANRCTVLLVPFGFKADALKAGAQLCPAAPLVRTTATEVRIKLPIQLWLDKHHPQGIEAPASCAVLAIAFSFGG